MRRGEQERTRRHQRRHSHRLPLESGSLPITPNDTVTAGGWMTAARQTRSSAAGARATAARADDSRERIASATHANQRLARRQPLAPVNRSAQAQRQSPPTGEWRFLPALKDGGAPSFCQDRRRSCCHRLNHPVIRVAAPNTTPPAHGRCSPAWSKPQERHTPSARRECARQEVLGPAAAQDRADCFHDPVPIAAPWPPAGLSGWQ
jgi:hypothetical protein